MKFWRIRMAVALSAFLAAATGKSAESANDWALVWSDEFGGESLDRTKWEFEVDARGGGNQELQYYVTNNVRVGEGFLTIEARQGQYTGPEGTREYTSSRLRTKRRGDWLQGQVAAGKGHLACDLDVADGQSLWRLATQRRDRYHGIVGPSAEQDPRHPPLRGQIRSPFVKR